VDIWGFRGLRARYLYQFLSYVYLLNQTTYTHVIIRFNSYNSYVSWPIVLFLFLINDIKNTYEYIVQFKSYD